MKTWLGGIRQARKLIGQAENSTVKWTSETALAELKKWLDRYGRSPGAIKADMKRKGQSFDLDELRRGQRIVAAVQLHFGTLVDACVTLGLKPSRLSPKRTR